MDDFALLHKDAAERGEHGAAILHLQNLAGSLRNQPSPAVCAAAAELLERAARGGAKGAAMALYLIVPNRRPETERDNEIRERVFELLLQGVTLPNARKEVAIRFKKIKQSRIKAITQNIPIPIPITHIDTDWVEPDVDWVEP